MSNKKRSKRKTKVPVVFNDFVMGNQSHKIDELIRFVNIEEIRVYENVDEISAGEKGEIRDEDNDDLNTYCVSNDDKDEFDVATDTNVDYEEKTEGEVKSYANAVQKNDNNVDTSLEYKPTEISEDGTEFVIFDEEIVAKGRKYGVTNVQMDRQGICYFKFPSNEGLERVLKQGPWIKNNKPLFVQKWNPILGLEKVDATKIPVWAKLINIPLEA
ncbi:RNA-directed DNA polymerase, eukaryota, reverse transcriptase zinc-binding domain protein, partial [Tanacetum coccineum]